MKESKSKHGHKFKVRIDGEANEFYSTRAPIYRVDIYLRLRSRYYQLIGQVKYVDLNVAQLLKEKLES